MQPSPDSSAFDTLLKAPQWSLPQAEKEALLLPGLNALTARHRAACEPYGRILDAMWTAPEAARIEDVPFVPASLFKTHFLSSVPASDLRMTMTSSGTTGQAVSRIAIDAVTAQRQTKSLNTSVQAVLGSVRPPMLVADTRAVISNPALLNARGAGVLGMMRFGRDHTFLLDDDLRLQEDQLHAFLAKHAGTPFFVFGFTFMVWQYLYQALKDGQYDLSGGVMIHSGGWKKLQSQAVSPEVFRASFRERCGMTKIYNFYGMVEQMGSIFLEGADGLLYPPNVSDVIIRDPDSLDPLPPGETGVIQVLSLIPSSYPGHSILTEDLGVIEHVDAGLSGRQGKALRIVGRVPKVELRGCSDVFAKAHG
jgi:hypothetical protein